jgi:soluble P-type ATPase
MGHALMDNRNGLAVAGCVSIATGRAERELALQLIEAKARPGGRRITLGGDKNYDTAEMVRLLREMNVTPHVAQNERSGRARSTAEPLGMPVTRSPRESARGSRRSSVGSRPWVCCVR